MMLARAGRLAAGLGAASLCLCVPLVASVAPGAAASLPDLKVTNGSVAINGLGDRISGRFTVRNDGGSRARSSTAYVRVKQEDRYRYLTELRILRLAGGKGARYAFRTETPSWLSGGRHAVRVCLDVKKKVRESREGNNCRSLGAIRIVNDGPFAYTADRTWFVPGYYGRVPGGYDDSHQTPSALFVWLHGCGGRSRYDIETYAPDPLADSVMIAPTGAEGGCWSPPGSGADEVIVTSVIADARARFNIDPGRVVLGGYSSGGDLSYRYAYRHSTAVDAVLVANSAPFRDTGLTQEQALDAATTKFRVVHLAHTEDDVYPIGDVRSELQALVDAGFSVASFERSGEHYDANTDADIREVLLPQVDP